MVARRKLNRLRIDFAKSHFWSGQIGHDRDAPLSLIRGSADAPNDFSMVRKLAVRKIQPCHIQPSANQTPKHFRTF
jgi:hypothetical protein